MSLYLKDPAAVAEQAIDWRDYLGGRLIVASAWQVAPQEAGEGGLAVASSRHDTVRTAARLSGGRVGRVYTLTNRVTLSDGTVDERSLTLRVEQR